MWKTLETKGPQSAKKLKKATKLDSDIFYMALGWLAREDKIDIKKTGKTKIKIALK